jgi:excinuclease ABC subunit A
MQFLPDVTVPCEICHGARYNREALDIRYKDKTIAEILDLTVDEAVEVFEANPSIRRKLSTIQAVGLGYIKLGQPATTLSGGEAQRVKLSTELSKRSTGKTLYILDEPTTGLSFHDVEALLGVLQALVDGGNTVVVIEHHLDVIKNADHVIDLGPAGGERGGEVMATGTPEEIAADPTSFTGQFLRETLGRHGRAPEADSGNGAKRTVRPKAVSKKPAKSRTASQAKQAAEGGSKPGGGNGTSGAGGRRKAKASARAGKRTASPASS